MSELRDLYQEMILDHHRHPHNYGPMPNATCSADGYNPLCGDRVTVHVTIKDDKIQDVHFEGQGCAISTASASMMTDSLKGCTLSDADKLFNQFHLLVTGEQSGNAPVDLGKLAVFSGVSEFPARVKCATLAWHTLQAAIHHKDEAGASFTTTPIQITTE